jgi:hypothetical protein
MQDLKSPEVDMRRSLLTFAAIVLPALSAFSVDNAFTGTWKLDPAKSSSSGLTLTYSKAENGTYHFSDGNGPGFDIGFEGKEYPVESGVTISQTMAGDNGWDSIWKMNGKVTSKDHGQISPDSKTLTLTQNAIRPDGSTATSVSILTRASGTTGPVGTWKLINFTEAPYTVIVTSPSEGFIRWELPEFKQVIEGKLDGSDLPVTGPETSPGQTEALTILSPTKISYTDKAGGKPIQMGVRTISSDGKTFTDESWPPGKESEKSIEVFTRH